MQTNSDFQMSQSSECASEKIGYQFMVFNSDQTYKEDCATKETSVQVESLNHSESIFVYNLPLLSSNCNSQILVEQCEANDIKSRFSTIEESSMSNSWDNNRDFTMARMNSDSLVLNKTGLNASSTEQQQKNNVKIHQPLSKSNQSHNGEIHFNPESDILIIVPNIEMVLQQIRQSELNPQLSVSRQIVHDSGPEHILENMLCPITINDNKPNQQLLFSNLLSLNMAQDCAFTEHIDSHEKILTFGNQNDYGDQKQYVATEIVNPNTTACSSDISHSSSMDIESTCPICQQEFQSKKDLKRHYKIHSGIKPVCSVCQKRFSDKCKLKRHIIAHTGIKPHKCEICGKFFGRKYDLGRHIRIHMGEKSHKCNTCGKLFPRKDALGLHVRIHTGEKPHKCEICGKFFGRKDDLGQHIRTHSGEKPHKCDICKMSFTQKHSLIRHVKRRHKFI